MKIALILLVLVGISLEFTNAYPSLSELMEKEDALEYLLSQKEDGEFSKRSLTRTGPEQRREAKEKYEEKCERNKLTKTVNKISQNKKSRWCPELTEYGFYYYSSNKNHNIIFYNLINFKMGRMAISFKRRSSSKENIWLIGVEVFINNNKQIH
jgi:hypothetical protein